MSGQACPDIARLATARALQSPNVSNSGAVALGSIIAQAWADMDAIGAKIRRLELLQESGASWEEIAAAARMVLATGAAAGRYPTE